MYHKLTSNIILSDEKLKAFPQDLEQDKVTYFHHFYSKQNWKFQPEQLCKKREIKDASIRKEEVKMSLFAGDMLLYVENPKDHQETALHSGIKRKPRKHTGWKL